MIKYIHICLVLFMFFGFTGCKEDVVSTSVEEKKIVPPVEVEEMVLPTESEKITPPVEVEGATLQTESEKTTTPIEEIVPAGDIPVSTEPELEPDKQQGDEGKTSSQ